MNGQKITKEAIIAEYLAGGISYRKLTAKYGISFQAIHQWVQLFQGKKRLKKVVVKITPPVFSNEQEPLPVEVKQLQKQLHQAKLENKLLNAIINIAEEQLGIGIRKKSGAKQS